MLKLMGRADASGLAGPIADDVWRVCLPEDADNDRGWHRRRGPRHGYRVPAARRAGRAARIPPLPHRRKRSRDENRDASG